MDDDIIPHIFEELKEIRCGIDDIRNNYTKMVERVATLEAVKINNERHEDSKSKATQMALSSIVTIIAMVAGKFLGFIK